MTPKKKTTRRPRNRPAPDTMEPCFFALYGSVWIQPTLAFKSLEDLNQHIITFNRYPIHGIFMRRGTNQITPVLMNMPTE